MSKDRVQRNGSRFGLRKILPGGRVRWMGRWYRLQDGTLTLEAYERLTLTERAKQESVPKYNGCMDGRKGLFYAYGPMSGLEDTIYLHNVDEEWPGPGCVGGVFHWERFRAEAGSVKP